MEDRPPLPPITAETAAAKVRAAEDAWNTRDPDRVALAYTLASRWRNRDHFIEGREAIRAFLQHKWQVEQEYRLIKELWAHQDNRIAVRFVYEWRDAGGQWWRSHGNENWLFAPSGHMDRRMASINDQPIEDSERLFRWPQGPRPADHPGLTELGL